MHADPQVEHRWLENLLGEWTIETVTDMGSDDSNQTSVGTERVSMLGDVWVVCELQWGMPTGGTALSQMTLGYDTQAKSYVGSFVSSCMTHLWVYTSGALDDEGKRLTLNTTGPSFTGNGTSQFQDIIEIVDEDHRILHAMMLDENEVWHEFMTSRYTRKK